MSPKAAEKCGLEKRKTVGGEDVLYSLATLGFENYAETLKIYLAKLRQVRLDTVFDHPLIDFIWTLIFSINL